MPRSRHDLGADAEDRAAHFLLELGYTIISRNFRVRGGEIDLIAMDGEEIVFVEVKFRSASEPEAGLTPAKCEALKRSARAFLRSMSAEEVPHRFDLVAIEGASVRHHPRLEIG